MSETEALTASTFAYQQTRMSEPIYRLSSGKQNEYFIIKQSLLSSYLLSTVKNSFEGFIVEPEPEESSPSKEKSILRQSLLDSTDGSDSANNAVKLMLRNRAIEQPSNKIDKESVCEGSEQQTTAGSLQAISELQTQGSMQTSKDSIAEINKLKTKVRLSGESSEQALSTEKIMQSETQSEIVSRYSNISLTDKPKQIKSTEHQDLGRTTSFNKTENSKTVYNRENSMSVDKLAHKTTTPQSHQPLLSKSEINAYAKRIVDTVLAHKSDSRLSSQRSSKSERTSRTSIVQQNKNERAEDTNLNSTKISHSSRLSNELEKANQDNISSISKSRRNSGIQVSDSKSNSTEKYKVSGKSDSMQMVAEIIEISKEKNKTTTIFNRPVQSPHNVSKSESNNGNIKGKTPSKVRLYHSRSNLVKEDVSKTHQVVADMNSTRQSSIDQRSSGKLDSNSNVPKLRKSIISSKLLPNPDKLVTNRKEDAQQIKDIIPKNHSKSQTHLVLPSKTNPSNEGTETKSSRGQNHVEMLSKESRHKFSKEFSKSQIELSNRNVSNSIPNIMDMRRPNRSLNTDPVRIAFDRNLEERKPFKSEVRSDVFCFSFKYSYLYVTDRYNTSRSITTS